MQDCRWAGHLRSLGMFRRVQLKHFFHRSVTSRPKFLRVDIYFLAGGREAIDGFNFGVLWSGRTRPWFEKASCGSYIDLCFIKPVCHECNQSVWAQMFPMFSSRVAQLGQRGLRLVFDTLTWAQWNMTTGRRSALSGWTKSSFLDASMKFIPWVNFVKHFVGVSFEVRTFCVHSGFSVAPTFGVAGMRKSWGPSSACFCKIQIAACWTVEVGVERKGLGQSDRREIHHVRKSGPGLWESRSCLNNIH